MVELEYPNTGISSSDISGLVRLNQGEGPLAPATRSHAYKGTYGGIEVLLKPYESPRERAVIEILTKTPYNLVIDMNDHYFIERISMAPRLEDQYAAGNIEAGPFGDIVGKFLGILHSNGVNYNHEFRGHLFLESAGLRAIDFGESRLISGDSMLDKNSEFVSDIVNALEYIRDSKPNHIPNLAAAVSAFERSYSKQNGNEGILRARKRHLKYCFPDDPLKMIFTSH